MTPERKNELRLFLESLAESLDISETQYRAAISHYEAVGEWLNKDDSPIAVHKPKIFPQGSFRLGTIIKPLNDTEEYDIDLVCEAESLSKEQVTQKQLKDLVGDRLKENELYRKMLVEGNRCWTLQYSDSARFHLDILPAIPDHDTNGLARMIGAVLASTSILITDKELREWQCSNPIGYAEWFKGRMRIQFDAGRMLLAESLRASVEDVPEYKVKTPLQRSIQILKRHRDIMFEKDPDNRPTSIIISTLAAQAYSDEPDVLVAIQNIVKKMPDFIKKDEGGNPIVLNPVNPHENFTDKWKKYPQRQTKFQGWLERVMVDIETALRAGSLSEMAEGLKPRFGDRAVNKAISNTFPSQSASIRTAVSVAPTINISTPSKPWGI